MSKSDESDLHGQAPDKARTALLLIDVINHFEFDGGEVLFERATACAGDIAGLRRLARERRVPVIYVNDNSGRWQSSFDRLIDDFLARGVRGAPVIERLRPAADDYHVLKPKASGFFGTPLGLLLEHLEVSRLVLAGFATERCVLLTAMDAYLRGFDLVVPNDCVAAVEPSDHRAALAYSRRVLEAATPSWRDVELP
jgi:nicotinamidase-related amidase